MSGSLLHDAFAHNVWATEKLLDACGTLTPAQLDTPTPGTYGSIIDTFRHIVRSDAWYLHFFSDANAIRDGSEVDAMGLTEMRATITFNGKAWMELLEGEIDPDQDVMERGDDWEFHSPMGVRLTQVTHHGTDHRSQICTALTSLGLEPPEIDVWAYADATGRQHDMSLSAP